MAADGVCAGHYYWFRPVARRRRVNCTLRMLSRVGPCYAAAQSRFCLLTYTSDPKCALRQDKRNFIGFKRAPPLFYRKTYDFAIQVYIVIFSEYVASLTRPSQRRKIE